MAKSAAFDPNQAAATPNAGEANEHYNWRAQLSNGNALDQEFVGVTHSLGSYLLFNALNPDAAAPAQSTQQTAMAANDNSAVQYIFQRTSLVYFFANQIQMLEITNLESAPRAAAPAFQERGLDAPPAPTSPAENFRALVNRWKQMQTDFQTSLHPGDEPARKKVQVVAWNDPSDVITFLVPRIGDVDVVNLFVQNAHRWFGLFESPTNAHDDYAKNKDVLRVMFESSKPTGTH
jgi:broad specificity phosphatase PhoE